MAIIKICEHTVEDFISIESGSEKVNMSLFKGKMAMGFPGWCTEVSLSPQQATAVGQELLLAANAVFALYA